MPLEIIASESIPSDAINDDRVGTLDNLAWAIDGATDIGDGPIIGERSDAAWLAEAAGTWLTENGAQIGPDLQSLLPELTGFLRSSFEHGKRREPNGRHEHPSASCLIARLEGSSLEYVAVGDCTMLVEQADGSIARYGTNTKDAGDAWLTPHIKRLAPSNGAPTSSNLRKALIPTLRHARSLMNRVPGYGVLSITEPPQRYIRHGSLDIPDGTRMLIASDGYLRLTDVYRKYTTKELLYESFSNSLPAMLDQLRKIEEADTDCKTFPRAKARDDASAILAIHRA